MATASDQDQPRERRQHSLSGAGDLASASASAAPGDAEALAVARLSGHFIVDAHTHIFPPEVITRRGAFAARDPWFAELYGDGRARMADADALIAEMANSGVDHSVTFSFGWRDPGLIEECNSYVIDSVRRFPGRLTGMAVIQPLAGPRAIEEVERCADAGLKGVGELMPHGQGYRLSDLSVMGPLVEACLAHDLTLLTHVSEPVGHHYHGKGDVTPADLYALLVAFPTLRVIAAHWGGGFPFYEMMPEVAAAAANLWYDSAASRYLYQPRIFSAVAAVAGPAKLLWASDYPLLSQRRMLAYLAEAELDEETLRLALGVNAGALFGLL